MTGFDTLQGFLQDPRFGIPLLLLLFGAATWLAVWPVRSPRRSGWEPPVAEPDRDSVSRSYLAIRRDQYSLLLRELYERLDRQVAARTGRSMNALPWRRSRARALGVPDPRSLARVRDEMGSLELWSMRLETDSWLRRDFWRSSDASRRQFLRRLARLLTSLEQQLTLWERTP